MIGTINFELVSPEARLVSEPVSHAIIPGNEGELGIGPLHASFVVALKPGVVRLMNGAGKEPARRIFITGGFADITGERCIVLAEEAVNVEDLDEKTLRKQIKVLEEDLSAAKDPAEQARIRAKIYMALEKLKAVTGALFVEA